MAFSVTYFLADICSVLRVCQLLDVSECFYVMIRRTHVNCINDNYAGAKTFERNVPHKST
jgi:hypothetical protein